MNVVFLTRGHGFGHAARDLRLIRALEDESPGIGVEVLAAGTAVRYYRERGVPCTDLGIPDEADISVKAGWAIWRHLARGAAAGAARRWDLLVTDELVPAVPFAHHVLEIPAVVLTDWFFADFGRPRLDRAFDLAAEVIVLDFAQSHPQPPHTAAPVHYAGPLVAGFGTDRERARAALGRGPVGLTAVLSLGGMPDRPETRRMTAAVFEAWHARAGRDDRLFVLADPGDLLPDGDGRASPPGVTWVGLSAEPERYHAAADAVIVDAMGFTACELVHNGGRVIGLLDEEAVERFPASFRHRVRHMAAQGWITAQDPAAGPERIWELISGAGQTAPGRPMPVADVADLARRLLRHA